MTEKKLELSEVIGDMVDAINAAEADDLRKRDYFALMGLICYFTALYAASPDGDDEEQLKVLKFYMDGLQHLAGLGIKDTDQRFAVLEAFAKLVGKRPKKNEVEVK